MLAAVLLPSCASEFKLLQFPEPAVLLQTAKGLAIVYVLRTAHDSQAVDIYLDGIRTAQLPKETYTVLMLSAGSYTLSTNPNVDPNEATPITLVLSAGDRRFVYTSSASSRRTWLPLLGLVGAAAPLFMEENSADGARKLTECTEFDAQGFLSIIKYVPPEWNAAPKVGSQR